MSYIAKHLTRQHDGEYGLVDDTGCSWDTPADFLAIEVFGMCGCGCPEAALKVYRAALRLIGRERAPSQAWEEHYEAFKAEERVLFHGDLGLSYSIYYVLADKELTEHGGSVPGWLTEKGKDVLADLNALNRGRLTPLHFHPVSSYTRVRD